MTTQTQVAKTSTAFPLPAILKNSTLYIYFMVLALLALWGLSVATWGIPGLYLPAVGAVPVCFLLLLVVSRG